MGDFEGIFPQLHFTYLFTDVVWEAEQVGGISVVDCDFLVLTPITKQIIHVCHIPIFIMNMNY